MFQIILCEGKTDAIIISYFLIKKYHWTYSKQSPSAKFELRARAENEILSWYKKQDEQSARLCIWGVGGINNIQSKLSEIIELIKNTRDEEERFSKIVLIADRDDFDDEVCIKNINSWLFNSGLENLSQIAIGDWGLAKININKTPTEEHHLQILPIILPLEKYGDLETFLLNSLGSESEEDQNLVSATEVFISSLPDSPYLTKRRYRSKAWLGATLSVISPDWVFSTLQGRLAIVEWDNLLEVQRAYQKLSDL